ncbi:Cas10/Cmr2 second palm domain-containing protein [Mastigocoleus testarum]|uniref:Cas10/Cmr2 second palm domain-containing protein n=1 Tax=Mastigocoleus testarum BC008 TaxID=371196 RepID=A0A0V7ZN88_9CYAN|nr:hypothetical protein [Mastigocoleus testarum]KST66164.1 hypothetical protein BC008_24640 [Mastigocoleus testarum BC008]
MSYTVIFIDTTGIQNYIFSSNRLRENIGASYLVSAATGKWVRETLEKELNIPEDKQTEPIENSNYDAELVYGDGGNALLIFKEKKAASKFSKILSKRVLLEAAGLNLLIANCEFDWYGEKKLYQLVKELITDRIERQKHERSLSVPLLGLGVTATCNSNLLPAVASSDKYIRYDDDEQEKSYLISTETKHKLIAAPKANEKLEKLLARVINSKCNYKSDYKSTSGYHFNFYQFPYRTDNLGRSEGESSYAAVIHADGNGMGKRFQNYGEGRENRDYIIAMRKFSQSIKKAGENALIAVIKTIINSLSEGQVVGKQAKFSLKRNNLPFRPLIYGGDDTTFVCEGRLGLELAALYLQELEKQPVADGIKLTACAGICVVKTHYPFARAYSISEVLCQEAKKFVKNERELEPEGFSALDWHLAASGLIGTIKDIRQREYQENSGNLNMRPLRLQQNANEWRTWEGFTQVLTQFYKDKK